MTTIAQLTKAAKESFIPAIEKYGFKHYGKLVFSRVVGDGVHQVIAAELSYGENLKFIITCFVEEFDPKYMERYPMNIPITSGGELGEALLAGELWEVDTLNNIDKVFEDVEINVIKYALPWFSTVESRKDYVRVLYPHLKEKLEEQNRISFVLNSEK